MALSGVQAPKRQILAEDARLGELAALCTKLRTENLVLREQHSSLIEERARLVEKNETARTKVEQMIIRLKSMEAGQ